MNEIGSLLKETREANGVSVKEASEDLDIKEVIIDNIEDGNIGAFKNIFLLQESLYAYAKYLGLDTQKIENDFNDYMFEYTSKIPKRKLEKAIQHKSRLEKKDDRIYSPYTKSKEKDNSLTLYILYSLGIIVCIIIIIVIIKLTLFS